MSYLQKVRTKSAWKSNQNERKIKTTITKRASSRHYCELRFFRDDLREVKKTRRNKFANNIVNSYRFICSFDLYGWWRRAEAANPCSITYIFAYTTKQNTHYYKRTTRQRKLLLLLWKKHNDDDDENAAAAAEWWWWWWWSFYCICLLLSLLYTNKKKTNNQPTFFFLSINIRETRDKKR